MPPDAAAADLSDSFRSAEILIAKVRRVSKVPCARRVAASRLALTAAATTQSDALRQPRK